jgi:hypothetical protein
MGADLLRVVGRQPLEDLQRAAGFRLRTSALKTVLEQIDLPGAEVLPALRAELGTVTAGAGPGGRGG